MRRRDRWDCVFDRASTAEEYAEDIYEVPRYNQELEAKTYGAFHSRLEAQLDGVLSIWKDNEMVCMRVEQKNGKNIQQRVFASGHPPNY